MSLGVEKLLPFDCLNINEFWGIHMDTYSDAYQYSLEQELFLKFHNFGGEYQFTIEFACLAYIICLKRRLISVLTVWDRSYI